MCSWVNNEHLIVVSFFYDFCLFQDLMMKQIIGKGCESGGLYILDFVLLRHVSCSGATTLFKSH